MENLIERRRLSKIDSVDELLIRNEHWAKDILKSYPDFFGNLSQSQKPSTLWIGCSDSRVPAETVCGVLPGEFFVHRNIGNVLPYNDHSSSAVLHYAVGVLKVQRIIICGHYSCGGVGAALQQVKLGGLDDWLKHIRDVRAANTSILDAIEDPQDKINRLVELNVIQQVHNTSRNTSVMEAKIERGLTVHGLIYNIYTGRLQVLDVPEDPHADIYLVS